jgi:hypothetical protein
MKQELEQMRNTVQEQENTVYIVTSGRGRKRKAHVKKEDEREALCERTGKNTVRLDEKTVKEHYERCSFCLKLLEQMSRGEN